MWGGSGAESGRGEIREEREGDKETQEDRNKERPCTFPYNRRKLLKRVNKSKIVNRTPFPTLLQQANQEAVSEANKRAWYFPSLFELSQASA